MRVDLAAALNRMGLSVLLFDYRGYGGNPGRPSEDGLAADARAAQAWLAAQPGVEQDRVLRRIPRRRSGCRPRGRAATGGVGVAFTVHVAG